jgi:uncharacterized protein DUF5615
LLLLDASVPKPIARALNLLNVAAEHATDFLPDNASDEEIVKAAAERQAILITLDNDFQAKKQLFLDIAARGITVAVIRPPKGAKMDVIAEIILWSYRKFYEIHDLQGPSAITVRQPTMKARAYKTIEFGRIEPSAR